MCTMFGSHICGKVNEDGTNGAHDLTGRTPVPKSRPMDKVPGPASCTKPGMRWCAASKKCQAGPCAASKPSIVGPNEVVLPRNGTNIVLTPNGPSVYTKVGGEHGYEHGVWKRPTLQDLQAAHESEAAAASQGSRPGEHKTGGADTDVLTEKASVVDEVREAHAIANARALEHREAARRATLQQNAEAVAHTKLAEHSATDLAQVAVDAAAKQRTAAAVAKTKKTERAARIRTQNLDLLKVSVS